MNTFKDMVSLVFSFINWKILISLIIIIFGLGYGTFYLINSGFFNKDIDLETKRQPTGMLYASLAKLADPVGIMSFDLASSTQSDFTPFITFPDSVAMQYHSTNDVGHGSAGLFAMYIPGPNKQILYNNIVASLPDGTVENLLPHNSGLTQVQHLSYSEASDWLVFSAKFTSTLGVTIAKSDTPASVNSRTIFITNPANKEIYTIAPGSAPAWSPDGSSILYLGATDLMQYDLETGSSTVIDFGAPGTAYGENMNLAVSEDGTKVAITSPNQAALYVGDITSWSPVTISNLRQVNPHQAGEFSKAYFWPVFSPDSEFLAVQAADIKNQTEMTNSRIDILDLENQDQIVRTLPTNQYDFTRAFVDEWDY